MKGRSRTSAHPIVPKYRESLRFKFTSALLLGFLGFEVLRRLMAMAIPYLRLPEEPPIYAIGLEVAVSLLVASVVAYVFSNLVARWMTDRLVRFAQMVAVRPQPTIPHMIREDPIPGPFDDHGSDEISAVARAMNQIRERVDEQTRAFALKDIRRREWIAQVSHDLRTPLTAQAACLDRAIAILASDSESELSRADLTEMLSVAKLDGDRVQLIADDLLEIARLEAGDRLQLEPVPPVELVRQAARGMKPWAEQKGIEIKLDAAAYLPMLQADGRRLMRAIENLIRNALQYANSEVTVLAMLSETNVRFEVRDDGRGLPKDPAFLHSLRQKTADKRLRDLAKRRSRADSAGLGLTVAQRVAEAHGGKVDAYNLSSGGAAFLIEIPVPIEEMGQDQDEDLPDEGA